MFRPAGLHRVRRLAMSQQATDLRSVDPRPQGAVQSALSASRATHRPGDRESRYTLSRPPATRRKPIPRSVDPRPRGAVQSARALHGPRTAPGIASRDTPVPAHQTAQADPALRRPTPTDRPVPVRYLLPVPRSVDPHPRIDVQSARVLHEPRTAPGIVSRDTPVPVHHTAQADPTLRRPTPTDRPVPVRYLLPVPRSVDPHPRIAVQSARALHGPRTAPGIASRDTPVPVRPPDGASPSCAPSTHAHGAPSNPPERFTGHAPPRGS